MEDRRFGKSYLPFFVVGLYQADCLLSHLFINQTTYKQIASEYLQSHARQTDTEILYGTEKSLTRIHSPKVPTT